PHANDGAAVARPSLTHRVAVTEGDGRDHDRLTDHGRPVIEKRRDEHDRDGGLVAGRVEGDDHTGREREPDGAPPAIATERARIAGEDERAGNDRNGAADRERRGVLAEDRTRSDRREKRTARARDRIDEREISGAISGRQRREVKGLKADRDRDEHERWPTELRPRNDEDRDRERREHDRADDVCEK